MRNRAPKQEEALLEYGNYTVAYLEEPFEDSNDTLHNYGIYNDGVCEATTSTMPQAMSIAIALGRALVETVQKLEEEEDTASDLSSETLQ